MFALEYLRPVADPGGGIPDTLPDICTLQPGDSCQYDQQNSPGTYATL